MVQKHFKGSAPIANMKYKFWRKFNHSCDKLDHFSAIGKIV